MRCVRTVIWMAKENYERWKSTVPFLDHKNMERALMKLLDIYELACKLTGKKRADEVIMEMKKLLGESVNLKVVER